MIVPLIYCHSMSSLKELTEDTTDRQDIRSRMAHLKTYAFFVFYQPSALNPNHPILQKMHFKLKDQRGEAERQVQLQFYNLEEEGDRTQGLLDLKQAGAESKAKIVAYCQQDRLMALLDLAARLGMDPAHTPIVLTYPHPHSDFAIFTGWNSTHFGQPNSLSIFELQQAATRWIHSSQERVDVWQLSISLHEGGRLQRQVGKAFEPIETQSPFQQRFVSHVSLGYHVRLSKNYKERCLQAESQRTNKLIYGWESFKNFCCLRASNMRASTGVVSINYVDEKGETLQILKHLREYDGSQQSELEASRVVRSDRGILSLVVANIDRYHANKLGPGVNSKPGDGRAEIIVYQGVSKCRRLASVGDEILLKVQSEGAIDIQVGQAVYRCWGCKELKIRQSGRIRASINKEVLEC